jgi:uncharacterized protein (TIGR00251 family)
VGAAGVRVAVWLSPRSASAGLDGVVLDAAGKAWLKVRVTAAPEGGKANAQLLKLLAKAWRLTPGRLEIAAGAKDRRKTVLIKDGDKALISALEGSI